MTESELLHAFQLEAKKLMYFDYGEFGCFKPISEVSNESLVYMYTLINSIILKREEKMKEQDAIYYKRKQV